MTSYKKVATVVLLIAISGCGKKASEGPVYSTPVVIEGEITQSSYDNAVQKTLEHGLSLIESDSPTEPELDGDIGRIGELLSLAEVKGMDKKHIHAPALLSTDGSLYALKARIHRNSPRTFGDLITTSFNYLDRAVRLDPQDLTPRIHRGIICSKVPDFLDKTQMAHDDLTFVRDSADFQTLSPRLQDTVNRLLAEVNSRLADPAQ